MILMNQDYQFGITREDSIYPAFRSQTTILHSRLERAVCQPTVRFLAGGEPTTEISSRDLRTSRPEVHAVNVAPEGASPLLTLATYWTEMLKISDV